MKRQIAALVLVLSGTAYFAYPQETEAPSETVVTTEIQDTQSENTAKKRFRINEIKYDTEKGITKAWALKRHVEIKKDLVLESENDLENCIRSIYNQLANTRLLDEIRIEREYGECDEAGITPVNLFVTVTDSKHIMALPRPSYSSNSGAELKLKLKDSNFLGFMNTLDLDLNAAFGNSTYPNDFSKIKLGTNFSYAYPFNLGVTENTWTNSFRFDWTIGESHPEFRYDTGVNVGIPFGNNRLNVNFTQSIVRENDYIAAGDELYFVENAGMSIPLTLGYINDVIPVRYTPSVSLVYNWDHDGVTHGDLIGPSISVNQNLAIYSVNWMENFRNGYTASLTHYLSYNFNTKTFVPFLSMDAKFYKAFKYMGINASFYTFSVLNTSQNNLGWVMRGILDNQRTKNGAYYALQSDMAIQMSLDFPIHIITTDWCGWGYKLFGAYDDMSPIWRKILWFPHKVFKNVDFELQLSPFIDVALTHNHITDRRFSLKDGFYDAGLEVLVYPSKWRSYVIRASVGFDMGRIALSDWIDTSWRDENVKKYEIYFGLGLQF